MHGKFEIYVDRAGKWRYRLKASNGQVVANGDAYDDKDLARAACENVMSAAGGAKIEVVGA